MACSRPFNSASPLRRPPIPCSQLAKLGDMPERFLLQVLRTLVNQGLLRSTRGVDGGYRLTKPLSQITLLDIVEATDGPIQPELPQVAGLSGAAQRKLTEALGDIAADAKKRLGKRFAVDAQAGHRGDGLVEQESPRFSGVADDCHAAAGHRPGG